MLLGLSSSPFLCIFSYLESFLLLFLGVSSESSSEEELDEDEESSYSEYSLSSSSSSAPRLYIISNKEFPLEPVLIPAYFFDLLYDFGGGAGALTLVLLLTGASLPSSGFYFASGFVDSRLCC